MSLFRGEEPIVREVQIANVSATSERPAKIFYGSAVTRAAAAAEVDGDKSLPIGSMYISSGTGGAATTTHTYIKTQATGTVGSDWGRITVTAAD